MEQNFQTDAYKEKLYSQIEEAYGKIVYDFSTQINQAVLINKRGEMIKWIEIILSAVSAGGFFATILTNQIVLSWIGGLCSTALIVLSTCSKELDLENRQKAHIKASNKFWDVREEYLSLLTDFDELEVEFIKKRRDELKEKTLRIIDTAPLTDSKSYERAKKDIQQKESQFFSREELNNMLPASLRKNSQGSL